MSGNQQTNLRAKDSAGNEIAYQNSQTDAPLIPIGAVERLHQIMPARAEWVFNQTEVESAFRRKLQNRLSYAAVFEKIINPIVGLGLFTGLMVLIYYLSKNGDTTTATALAGGSFGTAILAIWVNRKK